MRRVRSRPAAGYGARVRPPLPRPLEIAALRGVGALSRLAGRGGGTTLPGKLLWKLDPGADRPARGAAAAGLGARLGDERQDDDDGDGRRDPAAARARRPQQLGREPRLGRRLRPCWRAAAPSWACSRSTRPRCPRSRAACARRRCCSATSSATSSTATASSSCVAARWREAVAALPDAMLVVNARRSRRWAISARGRERACVFGVDDPRVARPALQHAADSKYCLALRHAVRLRRGVRRPPRRLPLPGVRPRAAGARRRGARDRAARARRRRVHARRRRRGRRGSSWRCPGLYNVYNALGAGGARAWRSECR